MNHNTNSVDNQYLLNTPLAYVLQDKTLKEIEAITDENGWNILHWAVATGDIPKIKELIHFNFKREVNSKTNLLPAQIYIHKDKKKDDCIKKPTKIPFCIRGFTPIHLAMFLFSYYKALKDDFFYEQYSSLYEEILSLLISQEGLKTCTDGDEYSLFDYAFLLEDVKSIELLHMHDPEFKTLNKIKPITAKVVIETMDIKYGKCGIEHILDLLNITILKQKLETTLSHNTKVVNNTTKKI